jgi:2-hydroxy-3-keto-5-methylthiopentenyl-1-phosphate phosphatase
MAQPKSINTPQTLLILDWDGTVAAHDTLNLIAPSPDALKPYTEAYMADYKALSDKMGRRDSLSKMPEWLDAMQGELGIAPVLLIMANEAMHVEVEYTSVKRVEDGGLFRGMPKSDMLARARDTHKLQLQDGIVELLKSFQGTWGIVSVGWSGAFIRAALESRGVDLASKNVMIKANEVEFDEDGLGTGKLSKHKENSQGIRTAREKRREMQNMVKGWREQGGRGAVVVSI